jgi:hypothetical protein
MSGSKRARSPSLHLSSSSHDADSSSASSPPSSPHTGWIRFDPNLKLEDCIVSDSSDEEEEDVDQSGAKAAKTDAELTRMMTVDMDPFVMKMQISRRASHWVKYTQYALSVDYSFKGDPALALGREPPFMPCHIRFASLYWMVETRLRAIPQIGMTPLEEIEIRLVDDLTRPPLGINDIKISALGIGPETTLYVCIVPWEDDDDQEPPRKKKRPNKVVAII